MIDTTTINLPGYHFREKLYEGTRTLVYRGQRDSDGQAVVIKILRNEYPNFSELIQFRNQCTIAKNLDISGIVRPLVLEPYGHSYALIMVDEGYVSLQEWLWGDGGTGRKLVIREFLNIAVQLAEILHGLYQNRVIHKDIKPANILIQPETQQVKLIDFSIASLLPKETQEIQNPNVLEGTLAYISPEQTGRMNRGIDYRSDFYSLGVTFYQLLTGKLPFTSDDPMELVHCHLATTPHPPISPSPHLPIPQVVSDIVMKLMAKNAEDRYQSALGLKYDLEKCLGQLETKGEIEAFELGERDICDRFIIPEKLYGREKEVQTLLNAFMRVASPHPPISPSPHFPIPPTKRSEILLVTGHSGIGKTAVINEVHKPITRQKGYFVKGKFDQFQRNIPFSAFVQALRSLMGNLLSESDSNLEIWRDQILGAVGDSGQVLIEVIPELEQIIGKQPPAPELSGNAAQNRFNLLFQKFIAVFTTPEHPLVIFLDDLQWADSASLNLMEVLMEDSNTGYLLLLGAYRDNEVSPTHPLILSLAELEKTQAAISTITLEPLNPEQINLLVAETLSCAANLAQPLTELVYQKTKGNPFFTTQFLKGLYGNGLLFFNLSLGYWQCDLAKVQKAALTDDVVAFMARQLQKLPQGTQKVLKLAACIGNSFDLETLAVICEQSETETATALWRGLQEEFILPTSEIYKFFHSEDDSSQIQVCENQLPAYRFLHDRVQQAAYSLIPEQHTQATHLQIGRLLLRNTSESEQGEKIFPIVNQLNQGSQLITDKKEQANLARLNLGAGEKAKLSTAFATALEYGKKGIQLLSLKPWQAQYKLCLDLHRLAAEAAYSTGEFETGLNLIELALESAQTVFDKVRFYQIKIDIYVAQEKGFESIQMGREILGMLGVELPESLTPEDIEQIFSEVKALIPEGGTEALLALPTSVDLSVSAAMETLAKLSTPIFTTNPTLFPLIFSNILKQTLKQGTTAYSAVGYSHYSMLLCSKPYWKLKR